MIDGDGLLNIVHKFVFKYFQIITTYILLEYCHGGATIFHLYHLVATLIHVPIWDIFG